MISRRALTRNRRKLRQSVRISCAAGRTTALHQPTKSTLRIRPSGRGPVERLRPLFRRRERSYNRLRLYLISPVLRVGENSACNTSFNIPVESVTPPLSRCFFIPRGPDCAWSARSRGPVPFPSARPACRTASCREPGPVPPWPCRSPQSKSRAGSGQCLFRAACR